MGEHKLYIKFHLEDSYKIGVEFIEKFKAENSDNLTINYITNTPSPSL